MRSGVVGSKRKPDTLARSAWVHDAAAALEAHGKAGEHVFTITPEITFDTQEHGPVSLEGLESLCVGIGPNDQGIRLSASFIDPAGVNATRCQARMSPQDNRLLVHDHMTDLNHRPVELEPKPWTPASIEKFNKLIGKAAR